MGEVFPKVAFFDSTLGKTVKAAAYVAISAVIAYLVTATSKDPQLFGVYTVVINAGLVAIKGLISDQPNLPK